jgi:molecular chaperone HtpG
MGRTFQVDLRGIVDLLSHHLYSSPRVYLRELLQNAADAISAREALEKGFTGAIRLETGLDAEGTRTLLIEDDGIGLTESEVHEFLSTIGKSSKQTDLSRIRRDFIGQFGIGLLAAFMVSDEIVVTTRSAQAGSPTLEWRGRADGTYELRRLDKEGPVGTRIVIRARPATVEYLEPDRVGELAIAFGSLLPHPITLDPGGTRITLPELPWQARWESEAERHEALLEYGRRSFGMDFVDVIPLEATAGAVEGLAFVMAAAPSPASRPTHRVYVKRMLVSEGLENVLPDWAFFVRVVINADRLRPTASREALYDDRDLRAAREELGVRIRSYLMELAQTDNQKLSRLVAIHYLSLKALAVHDDEFFRIFADWLPVETTLGRMTLGEVRRHDDTVRYAPTVDEFRQLLPVAASESICVVNGGYVYDTELVERSAILDPPVRVERTVASDLVENLEEMGLQEREYFMPFLRLADSVLAAYGVRAEVKRFRPAALPAVLSIGQEALHLRAVERSREVAGELWSSILDGLTGATSERNPALLCFNASNPVVTKLAAPADRRVVERAISLLYVQSLVLGHRPLGPAELQLLTSSISDLLDLSAEQAGAPTFERALH